jgi:signal transduction histidine kinase
MPDRADARVYWAHRLHATVLNSIGAAILQSQVCEQAVRGALPTSVDELVRLQQMLVTLERETRALASSSTHPRGGTLHAEVAAGVRAARALGLPVRVRIRGRAGAVSGRIARGAAVVLGEALANAARHAHPSSVEVEVTVREEAVLLRVRDDGAGCDTARMNGPAPGGRRCGLTIMRAQAAALGGRLEFSSVPGRGTQVTLFAPRGTP